jgi:hypothetical protein
MADCPRCDGFSFPASPPPPLHGPTMTNHEGPDLLEMIFVAFVLAGIAYSFTH